MISKHYYTLKEAQKSIMNDTTNNERVFTGKTKILEFGTWIPEQIIENGIVLAPLFKALSLNLDDMIRKTGVAQRCKSDDSVSVLDMAEHAVKDLMSRTNTKDIAISEIDTIIYASVTRMMAEPSTAIMLQKRLGIESAISFDISNACLSFVDGLIVADSLISAGRSKLALVVSAEKGARVAEMSLDAMTNKEAGMECMAALTLGDGAAAALVAADDSAYKGAIALRAFTRASRSQYAHCCTLQSTNEPMMTDSNAMFEGALLNYPPMLKTLIKELGWNIEDIEALVPHQASLKVIQTGLKSIGYPIEKTIITLDQFGNMASVSVPFTISRLLDQQKPATGSKIAVAAFGSGLSFSMLALEVL
ncbi:MAG TPA: 3-oxoacyl-[acyl-carrier-protein] synthase III C-terminal domain-containing protein [Spirochaetota bacterium]|nr:3-oxoacyl-[acyl-carrier-protein] synthase III C-terminal domain-containing protein [Spirochaetota bacterium]